jgi:hypothetical protein
MRLFISTSLLFFSLTATCLRAADPAGGASSQPIALFNGRDFAGLHVYIEQPNVPVAEVWTIEDGVLRASGASRGYVRTAMPYADYKLSLEWRWPKGRGNSGILLHIVNQDTIWPKGIEAQLATDRAGDLAFFFDARAKEEHVSRNPKGVSTGRVARRGPSLEKPLGEWNTLEILVAGDTITLTVNGTEANRITEVIPSAGMIGFQAEGFPIDFRNITLTPLPPAKDLHAPMPKQP